MNIKPVSILNEKQQSDILALHKICVDFDQHEIPFYAENEESFLSIPRFYLCSLGDGTLVGYLSLYDLDEHHAYVYAFVHPEHRRKQIFSSLFGCLQEQMVDELHLSFPVSPKNSTALFVLSHIGYVLTESEYTMECNKFSVHPSFSQDDLLVDCEEASTLSESTLTYSLYKGKEECFIGELQIYVRAACATIYNVEIQKENRSQGYGSYLLSYVLNDLFLSGKADRSLLQVSGKNLPALHLYQKYGFHVLEQLDYYSSLPISVSGQ